MADTFHPPAKFSHPDVTAKGETRASVGWSGLKTLWLNTGTLCNIECANCYIESSPKNDRLVYLTLADVLPFLDELTEQAEIGITGGEPFMCPDILAIMGAALVRGHSLLVLTNAMRPMMRPRVQAGLKDLAARYGARMTLRVSLDSHDAALNDAERGEGAFAEACTGLAWLAQAGIPVAIAGRQSLHESEDAAREGYRALIASLGLTLNADDAKQLVLFPEMIARDDPPEITTACWGILNKAPDSIMCSSQRMVVRRKGASAPRVLACTLLVDDPAFDLGNTLAEATAAPVKLNHPWCASFCVLGGASCSA
ncbi:radical SAM domain protein [Hyphomonas neptunium ATCC 15444]|uniref:Radical SAM domain protein n=2 Tax=Hyphomonas TaxID=85 RepID=Q0C4M1_HYPNA|nr:MULTISPECIES: radical SAM protein [Hyphomonas]ABI77202.1 radical SAM domain protein [Hyphomonas neptunium ATCC 15444]KCZ96467.1 radical SAM domain-containing protein [Hyphomonas hirschiana VP5]